MSDFYTEKLVKKQQGIKELLIKAFLIALAISSVVSVFLLGMIIFVPVIVIAVAFFVISRMDIEYEYLYVNGDLDVDKIIHKAKRKRIFSSNVKELELLAPFDAPELKAYGKAKLLDVSSGGGDGNLYAMVARQNNGLVKVLFEPDETILEGFRMLAPRKVIQKK